MISYTEYQTRYGQETNNSETTNLTVGLRYINDSIRHYCSKNEGKWWFLEDTATKTTVASQRGYTIPQSVRKIMDVYVTVGSEVYTPMPIESSDAWASILASQTGNSDRAMFWYREGNTLYLDPIPASNSNTITIRYRKNVPDLRNADYSTGTVSITSGATAITGSGTTFTAAMVGRFIRFTSGDGLWYEIASYTSATSIALVAPYEGTTLSGSAYSIGEMPVLPEAYHELPLLRACGRYYQRSDLAKAKMYFEQANDMFNDMVDEAKGKSSGAYMLPLSNAIFRDPNVPEPTVSTSAFV